MSTGISPMNSRQRLSPGFPMILSRSQALLSRPRLRSWAGCSISCGRRACQPIPPLNMLAPKRVLEPARLGPRAFFPVSALREPQGGPSMVEGPVSPCSFIGALRAEFHTATPPPALPAIAFGDGGSGLAKRPPLSPLVPPSLSPSVPQSLAFPRSHPPFASLAPFAVKPRPSTTVSLSDARFFHRKPLTRVGGKLLT